MIPSIRVGQQAFPKMAPIAIGFQTTQTGNASWEPGDTFQASDAPRLLQTREDAPLPARSAVGSQEPPGPRAPVTLLMDDPSASPSLLRPNVDLLDLFFPRGGEELPVIATRNRLMRLSREDFEVVNLACGGPPMSPHYQRASLELTRKADPKTLEATLSGFESRPVPEWKTVPELQGKLGGEPTAFEIALTLRHLPAESLRQVFDNFNLEAAGMGDDASQQVEFLVSAMRRRNKLPLLASELRKMCADGRPAGPAAPPNDAKPLEEQRGESRRPFAIPGNGSLPDDPVSAAQELSVGDLDLALLGAGLDGENYSRHSTYLGTRLMFHDLARQPKKLQELSTCVQRFQPRVFPSPQPVPELNHVNLELGLDTLRDLQKLPYPAWQRVCDNLGFEAARLGDSRFEQTQALVRLATQHPGNTLRERLEAMRTEANQRGSA